MNYDNDFFNATDRYYTQGVYFELIAPFLGKSPISKTLIPLNKKAQNYYGIIIQQDCFTPGSIRYDTLNYLDRPFAATMYLSHILTSIDNRKKRRLTTRLDLGVIGPCAVCEEEQKWIHKSLVNIAPLGWENQLATDYIINYSVNFEQGIFSKKHLELAVSADARAGTLYDDISAGLLLRTGFMNSYFDHYGVIKNSEKNKFQLYLLLRGKIKFVGYNATMQGGLFSKDIHALPDRSINRYVLHGAAGVVLAYKRVSLEYTKIYISPEFLKGRYHGWGHCNLTLAF
jgi:hypothetical protein